MVNTIPKSEEELKRAFEQFIQNPMQCFIVNVRRKRASELRELLSGSHILDTATFEREVWHIESQTYLREREFELQLFDKRYGQSRLEQILRNTNITLEELEHALDTNTLELHGNYIWGQGTSRYAPKQQDEEDKVAQIRIVIDILNNAALTPIEKVHRIDAVPGFGENNATGLVMIFYPEEVALVNSVIKEVIEKLGFDYYAFKSFDRLQGTLHSLKENLGAQDFIELDWFLYQYSSETQETVTDQEKQTLLDYVRRVLENTNEALNYTEITNRAIALGLQTKGKTPAQTVNAILTTNPDLFERVGRGKYRMRTGLPTTDIHEQKGQTQLDYVINVLKSANKPLNYTEITNRAIALGLQATGKTPTQTVNAILTTHPGIFERVGRGEYRLSTVSPTSDVPEDDVPLEEEPLIDEDHIDLPEYEEPPFDDIFTSLEKINMQIDKRLVRRYHLSLKTGSIVVLAGPSGTGKTWLAEAYAKAINAAHLLVPVAPNWTTNEDLLGYVDPLDQQVYHDTPFSSFLQQAAKEYELADMQQRTPRPYHVILDEMNLARVEYYFAKFLSAMEVQARNDSAYIDLGPQFTASLYPNLHFIGTINVDETTHGFADKVYDRAEVIALTISAAPLQKYIGEVSYQDMLMQIWNEIHEVVPFAYRVVKGIKVYISEAEKIGVPWQEALDEQILHKILPRCKGYGEKFGPILERLVQTISADTLPLSNNKVVKMLEGYKIDGIAKYF